MARYLQVLCIGRVLAAAWLLSHVALPAANAHDAKSRGQTIYLPIYSAIQHSWPRELDLTVTLSLRNLDPKQTVTIRAVDYFDTGGEKKKSLIEGRISLAPYAATQLVIKRQDFRGDIGANAIVQWEAQSSVLPLLAEAIMIGSDGVQGFSFSSRGVVIE